MDEAAKSVAVLRAAERLGEACSIAPTRARGIGRRPRTKAIVDFAASSPRTCSSTPIIGSRSRTSASPSASRRAKATGGRGERPKQRPRSSRLATGGWSARSRGGARRRRDARWTLPFERLERADATLQEGRRYDGREAARRRRRRLTRRCRPANRRGRHAASMKRRRRRLEAALLPQAAGGGVAPREATSWVRVLDAYEISRQRVTSKPRQVRRRRRSGVARGGRRAGGARGGEAPSSAPSAASGRRRGGARSVAWRAVRRWCLCRGVSNKASKRNMNE